MLLTLLVPGLSLTLALYPKKDSLDAVERVGMALVLGLTPLVLSYALNKNLGVPVNTQTTLLSIIAVSMVGVIGWWSRTK